MHYQYRGTARLDNVETFMGSAVLYGATKRGGIDVCICDYEVDRMMVSRPEQLRCHLLREQADGSEIEKVPKNALNSEVLLLVGRAASPANVITALKAIIESIKKEGLAIGPEEDIEYEPLIRQSTPRVSKRKSK